MHVLDLFLPIRVEMTSNTVKGAISAWLTGLGTMGNIFVFVKYMHVFASREMKPIHLILIHLAVTNIMTLLSQGVPGTLAVFGVRNFLDDTGCKSVVYLSRIARGLSICTTGLLTVVQAITMSPRQWGWRKLQPSSAWHLLPLCLFFWVLNSSIGMNLLLYITSISKNSSKGNMNHLPCLFQPENPKVKWTFLAAMIVRDIVFLATMGTSSVHIIFLLHKHHQRALCLQISKSLHKAAPEVRASKSVLLLMLCFVFFYCTDFVFSLFVDSFQESNSFLLYIWNFMTLGYAIVSPFVLIHREGHLTECRRALWNTRDTEKLGIPWPFP
ncbi:vomeronasal 1 receptor cavPorV1R663 [Cavia porcellus]|uniref:vomeronasal 1 receptor cavPorV1R663 n=1 Tax=Cavia porcellus TaxID=10141 RepID=UPI0001CF73E7|nr:vomeronasal 1 receptor cavPorV1R663 [Cavia porcellus]